MSSLHRVLNCLSFLHLYLLFYGRGLVTVMQADYINFVFKFPNFRYHGNLQEGSSKQSLTGSIKLTDPENRLVCASIWRYQLHKLCYSGFCAEIANFRCHGKVCPTARAKCDSHSWIRRHRKPYIEPKITTPSYDWLNLWQILWLTEFMANFLVKLPIFRYHGNRGPLSKVW